MGDEPTILSFKDTMRIRDVLNDWRYATNRGKTNCPDCGVFWGKEHSNTCNWKALDDLVEMLLEKRRV